MRAGHAQEAALTHPWLHVVGVGEDGWSGLSPSARAVVDAAQILVGGQRHLHMIPEMSGDSRKRLTWPSPLTELVGKLSEYAGHRVCVLATGDPFDFGVGVTLARHFDPSEMMVFPGPSAFSLVCARLGWDRNTVEPMTLHGRPLALLKARLYPGARLLILSHDGTTPGLVAGELRAAGYGDSEMTVLEHMGGMHERVHSATAQQWGDKRTADFNTIAVRCDGSGAAGGHPGVIGLPDSAFEHDGQLTKRTVRAASLARLAAVPGQQLWDLGAGAGSIAIEWMRAHHRNHAVAVERRRERVAMIGRNAQSLGVPGLQVISGEIAPAITSLESAPDAIFIGGGLSLDVVMAAWARLAPGGRLVANAVSVAGEACLVEGAGRVDGEVERIGVSHLGELGRGQAFRPAMPVTQLYAVKR